MNVYKSLWALAPRVRFNTAECQAGEPTPCTCFRIRRSITLCGAERSRAPLIDTDYLHSAGVKGGRGGGGGGRGGGGYFITKYGPRLTLLDVAVIVIK